MLGHANNFWRAALLGGASTISDAALMAATWAPGADALTLSFLDGSAYVKHAATPANDYNGSAYGLLTYTAPSAKMLRQSDGVLRFGAHNLYLNSAAPANQAITVLAGATYAITITGSVSVTASGAASGTWSAGTTTFTAATGTLTLGSTSGAGTVHLRRTPSVDTYLATSGTAAYALPYEWDASGNPIGLRVEEARTNLHTYSQNATQFSLATAGGAQPLGSGSIANAISSPDGTMTGTFVAEFTNSGIHYMFSNSTTTSTAEQTGSWFVKAGTRSKVRVMIGHGSAINGVYADFDLSTGTIITNATATGTGYTARAGSAYVEPYADGWYRCGVTASAASSTAHVVYVILLDGAGSASYVGDGVSGLYVWGAQLELGAFATSYIPTSGATVTRVLDTITIPTSKFAWSTQCTMYAHVTDFNGDNQVGTSLFSVTCIIIGARGSSINYYMMCNRSNTSTRDRRLEAGSRDGDAGTIVTLETSNNAYVTGTPFKIATSFNGATNTRIVKDGATILTGTTFNTPATPMLNLYIGAGQRVRSIMFFPVEKSEADMQSMTTGS